MRTTVSIGIAKLTPDDTPVPVKQKKIEGIQNFELDQLYSLYLVYKKGRELNHCTGEKT